MLGFVFHEFLDMVSHQFGEAVTKNVVETSNLPHSGDYLPEESYPHQEMMRLVGNLSKIIEKPIDDLVVYFGEHLVGVFFDRHPHFFDNINDGFTFLESVDRHIHIEVLKLFPNAEFPQFITERMSDDVLSMRYSSSRPLSNLARGLIQGAMEHFNEKVEIETTDYSSSFKNVVEFRIKKIAS